MAAKTIRERLMKQTKNELMDTAFRMGMTPPKPDGTKAEWAAQIEEELPECYTNLVLQMRQEEYMALSRTLEGGRTSVSIVEANNSENLYNALKVLERYGQAWRDTHSWKLSEEALKLMQPDDELLYELDINDILYDEMKGWLLYTGMMPAETLLNKIARMPDQPQDIYEGMYSLCGAILFGREGMDCLYTDQETHTPWIVHEDVMEPEELLARLREPQVAKLDYPELTTDELVRSVRLMGIPGYPKVYQELEEWMRDRRNMTDEDLRDTLDAMVFLIQNNDHDKAVECVLDTVRPRDKKDTDRGMKLLMETMNRIPQWNNKGHSPDEMVQLLKGGKAPKLPGRNDPCPCGSGKKYKQCCGRRMN